MGSAGLRSLNLFLFLCLAATPQSANASGLCDYYRKNSPGIYKAICGSGFTSTKPAGASSTFTSSFNLSSASLPSEPSSYGLETLAHRIREGEQGFSPTFSIVKGFNKFGTGISTGGNNTFYGDDVMQREFDGPEVRTFEPRETAQGKLPNLNLGTSFELAKSQSGIALKLGLSLRHNKISDKWGGGPALAIASPFLTVGMAFSKEQISNFIPPVVFNTFQVSARLWAFELEYNLLQNNSVYMQTPVSILTLTTTVKKLIFTVAKRNLEYRVSGTIEPIQQTHLALQYLFSKTFSGGLLHNYIPGATTLGVQIFL